MGKIIDETGNKYGYLTVIERAPNNKDNRAMWKCKCDCGNETIVSGKHLRSGNTQSCGCYQKQRVREIRKENHKDLIGKTFNFLKVLDYGRYLLKPSGKSEILMQCECLLCGSHFEARPYDIRVGNQKSCGCINSVGNTKIKLFLLKNNYNFLTEYKIKDCKDIKPLPFDFALFKNNELIGLIEYQGIQHFTCENHGWDNKEKFEKVQKHDKIKYEYCKDNNIKLFYITYKENIKERLEEILNELYR